MLNSMSPLEPLEDSNLLYTLSPKILEIVSSHLPYPPLKEELLNAILSSATEAIVLKDCDGRYLLANQSAERNFGCPIHAIIGKTDFEIFTDHPETAQTIFEYDQLVLQTGQPISYTLILPPKNESLPQKQTILHVTKNPFLDHAGNIVGVLGIARDITDWHYTEMALDLSERRYHTFFDANPNPSWIYDPTTLRFLEVNSAALRVYGYTREEFLKMSLYDIRPTTEWGRLTRDLQQDVKLRDLSPPSCWQHRKKNGSLIDVEISARSVYLPNGKEARLVYCTDVSERLRAEREKREASAQFEQAFHRANIGMSLLTLEGIYYEVNSAHCQITGYTRDELVGQSYLTLVPPERQQIAEQIFQEAVREGREVPQYPGNFLRKDGSLGYAEFTIGFVRDEAGKPLYMMGQMQDVSERYQAEERLRWLAYHDPLTGLYNRHHLEEMISEHISEDTQNQTYSPFALLLMDLDRFKQINDSYGHNEGDGVLNVMAHRFRVASEGRAIIGRMGGDEFTILLLGEEGETEDHVRHRAELLANRLLEVTALPVYVESQEIYLSGSIGISLYPLHGHNQKTLLKNADVAMYSAKNRGKGRFEIYKPAMNAASVMRLQLESSLRHALQRQEICVYYQPQVTVGTRHIVSVEALVRWNHPELGILLPDQFLHLANDIGIMHDMEQWVLHQACRHIAQWKRNGYPLAVAVNLSATQFSRKDTVQMVAKTLRETGLNPNQLVLEITESTLMENQASVMQCLRALKQLGVRISVDDFGTGYSSLSYLRDFPLDILKIDRSFIENLNEEPRIRAVVRTIIELARAMDLYVVAEGVERIEQEEYLKDMGCDAIQGYLVSKPISTNEMQTVLNHLPSV
jgi:diguanylate cyclase (GGDEF)-like protein/PAS domain S-box-containing protein